jgi:methylenetetrahydrofolate reductase (NADPH)
LELAEICQRQLGLTTCLHLTCTNTTKKVVDQALEEAKLLGIRNILALRGDPPRGDEYRVEGDEEDGGEQFVWAVDLVKYIRKTHGDYFCVGVAGYPEGHSDESVPAAQDPVHDMPYLVDKVKAGADFIMTQLFYEEEAYLTYEKLVRGWDDGVLGDIHIIPGLMPIQSYQTLIRTTKLAHAALPRKFIDRLEPVKGDDEEVKRAGVDIISALVQDIKQQKSPHPRGFHFYTLNLEKAVSVIADRCNLIPNDPRDLESESAVDESPVVLVNGAPPAHPPHRRPPSHRRPSSPHNRVMTDDSSAKSTLEAPSRATSLAISHGIGSLGREATWDDYPNGRFGDARSPAFGEIDGYGTSLHLSPAAARSKWGFPTSRAEIGDLFIRHLKGELDQLPWSEGPLNPETRVIQSQLCALIERQGWWSIASQPAVDGVKSDDAIFGWGPKAGFVFQKAFVEFFIPAAAWRRVLRPHLQRPDIAAEVSWYASSNPSPSGPGAAPPEFESSAPASAANSVTWGAFPGKEIVTPTIIEEISFRAWADEAFGIWAEWERCYAHGTASRRVLRELRDGLWLVNVIGHGYREAELLWDVLMAAGRVG